MSITKKITSLALVTLLLTWIVILLGATTRLNDAGLGCPDWPGCYGKWGVTAINDAHHLGIVFTDSQRKKAWLEMIHRYAAATLIFLSVILLFLLVRYHPILKIGRYFPYLMLLLLIFQGLLGRWTVTLQLHPVMVTLHLLGGFTFLCLIWYLVLTLSPFELIPIPNQKQLYWFGWLIFILLIGQITLGAWTSSQYAALVCPKLPFCSSITWSFSDLTEPFRWINDTQSNFEGGRLSVAGRAAIQMTHRMGAVILGLISVFFVWRALQVKNKSLHRLIIFFSGLLILQVLLGMTNILWFLPRFIAIAHNGVATLLLLTMITIIVFLKKSSAFY